jgi:hypothetical protein
LLVRHQWWGLGFPRRRWTWFTGKKHLCLIHCYCIALRSLACTRKNIMVDTQQPCPNAGHFISIWQARMIHYRPK